MSYILDALKRAERERKQGQVSVLDEIPSAAASAGTQRRRLPPIWLLAAIVVALAGLIYGVLSWRHKGETPNAAPAVAARSSGPAPAASFPPPTPVAAPPAAAPPAAAPQAPAATIEDSGKIATLDDVAPPAPPQSLPAPPEHPPFQKAMPPMPGPRAMPPAVAGNAAPAEEPGPAEAPPQGAPPPLPAPAENAAAAVQAENSAPPAAPAAQQPAAPTEMTSAPPPAASDTAQHSLKQMPESYRANFPAFSVDVHAYNDDPQRRFVLIDGKRYREGDTLAQGPRLVGIVPEGLVLEWQGQQVLYPVGH